MLLNLRRISTYLGLVLALSGCSVKKDQVESSPNPNSNKLVLKVEQQGYRFSMYPQYVNESKSLIVIDVRDKDDQFVGGAKVVANLKGADGHVQMLVFRKDLNLQRYVAELPLKHHEDYVVDTEVAFGNAKFKPEFIFHCGDPVPELVELSQEGSENK